MVAFMYDCSGCPRGTSPVGQQISGSLAQATPAGTTCRFQHEQKNDVQLLEMVRKVSMVSIPLSEATGNLISGLGNVQQDEMNPTVSEWYG